MKRSTDKLFIRVAFLNREEGVAASGKGTSRIVKNMYSWLGKIVNESISKGVTLSVGLPF